MVALLELKPDKVVEIPDEVAKNSKGVQRRDALKIVEIATTPVNH